VSVGLASKIGGACRSEGDCIEGAAPTCWEVSYLDRVGAFVTKDGYCSSPCTSDADCGSGVCVDEGADGKWCFSRCQGAADCRSGYACFPRLGNHCFPSGGLNCDPAMGDGTCAGRGSLPGGCIRRALGSGMTGSCYDGCRAGVGSCTAVNSVFRQCIVLDETAMGDAFKGGVCVTAYSQSTTGKSCQALDACVDGDECFLASFPSGDGKCHVMCNQTAACASGACADVFGLFGTADPIGLCL
jgi:hypothetical protein